MMRVLFQGDEIGTYYADLIGADGLDASACKVEAKEYATLDGAPSATARMGRRDVRLRYALTSRAEAARDRIYHVFPPKGEGQLRIMTDTKDLIAQAFVASIEVDPWASQQVMEVSLVCPDPWLYSRTEKSFTASVSGGTATWTVRNDGTTTGFLATGLAASGTASVGTSSVTWANATSGMSLDTREGSRDLFKPSGSARTSYLSSITAWGWPQIPFGEVTVEATVSASSPVLTIRERWAGI